MAGELATATRTIRVTIRDISANGALIVSSEPLDEHSPVELRRGELSAAGHVAWMHGNHAGIKFDEAVPAQVLEKTMPKRLVRTLMVERDAPTSS